MKTSIEASQSQACDRCHRRKTRCDKKRPGCTPCERARTDCVYSARTKEPVYGRSFVERLERRIHRLEAINKRLSAAVAPLTVNVNSERTLQTEDASQTCAATSADDVANEVSFMSTSAGCEQQYLGSTSGILLASLMTAGVATTEDGTVGAASMTMGFGGSNWSSGDSALPPEQLSRSLVEAYLAHDHLSYPFLHPRAVWATVDRIYSDTAVIRTHAFEAFMFSMILAIATSQAYKFDWIVLPDAETHYQRSMTHLNSVLREGGLRALQALLLMCQFRLTSSTKATSGSKIDPFLSIHRLC
jgi:hypothetical protein